MSDAEKAARASERRARQAAQLLTVTPRLFDVAAAARYTGMSTWTIRSLLENGVLRRVVIPTGAGKDLRAIRVDRADLDVLIASWKESK